MSSSSQNVHYAENTSSSISTYSQVVGLSTYQQPGIVHTVIPISAAGSAGPPCLLYDGWSTRDQIIGAVPGNQAVGATVLLDAPFQKGLFVAPQSGQVVIVTYSTSPFKN